MTEAEKQAMKEGAAKSQPNQGKSTNKQVVANPTEDQSNALVNRIKGAQKTTQSELAAQAIEFASAASDQVIEMATPFVALNIAEKSHKAISGGGKMATAFLRSMPITGMQIENVFETTAELDDPLYLMLTGV